jgi:hypothetical protein
MAISFIGGASGGAPNGADITLDLSGLSMQEGDLILVAHEDPSSIDEAMARRIRSTGFTPIADLFSTDTQKSNLGVYYGFVGATPPTSVVTAGTLVTTSGVSAAAMVFRGVDRTRPMAVAPTTATGIDSVLANPPSITPGVSGAWVVAIGGGGHLGGAVVTYGLPTGYTTNAQSGSGNDTNQSVIGMGYKSTPSGTEDPGAFTFSAADSVNYAWCAVTVALRPINPAPSGIYLVGSATATAITGTSDLTINLPAGIAANDLVIVAHSSGDGVDNDVQMTTAGYTEVADLFANDTIDCNFGVFYKKMGASPDTTAVCKASGLTNDGLSAVALVFRNVDTTPMDVTPTTATGINSGLPNPPSITPADPSAVVVIAGGSGNNQGTLGGLNFPLGYTGVSAFADANTDTSTALAYNMAPSSPEDPPIFTLGGLADGTTYAWCAVTMALAPGFAATDIAGCKVWYDFSDAATVFQETTRTTLATVDVHSIGGVTDKSGAGNHLSQATSTKEPLYISNQINGRAVARFDGVDDALQATMAADASWTIFIAAKKRSAVGTAPNPLFAAGSGSASVYTDSDVSSGYNYDLDSASASKPVGGTPTNVNVVCLRVTSAAVLDVYVNGGPATRFDPNNVITTATSYLYGTDTSTFGDYDIGEIAAYDTALSDIDTDIVGGGLAARAGITWTPVSLGVVASDSATSTDTAVKQIQASTAIVADATRLTRGGNAGRSIDYCQNGVLWTMLYDTDAATGSVWKFYYSTDQGFTWTESTGSTVGASGEGAEGSFFIDKDDYAHQFVVYSTGAFQARYRLGTPNAARTQWTWGSPLDFASTGSHGHAMTDVVAHRQQGGSGWDVHLLWSNINASNFTAVNWTWIRYDAAHAVTNNVSSIIHDAFVTQEPFSGSIDFRHTQADPKAVQASTPTVYATWAETVITHTALYFQRIAWNGTTWVQGTVRTLDANGQGTYQGDVSLVYDGTRVLVAHIQYSVEQRQLCVDERDEADTATTNRNAPMFSVGAVANLSIAYDSNQNIYLAAKDGNTADLQKSIYNRSGSAWSAWAVVKADSATSQYPDVMLMRGPEGGVIPLGVFYMYLTPTPDEAWYTELIAPPQVIAAAAFSGWGVPIN